MPEPAAVTKPRPLVAVLSLVGVLAFSFPALAQRHMELLGRGLVAIHEGEGNVFLSWRLLGTDPDATGFNVYRQSPSKEAKKLNEQPLSGPTHFRDAGVDLSAGVSYVVRAVLSGQEQPPSGAFSLPANAPAQSYLSVPMKTPDGYHANDCSVGDLDGDGEYEIVVHMVGRGRDNSQGGLTSEPIFHAYKLDGTLLWQINLGKNIREGAHYTQFLVYDFDGDGRAELVCKTADGTIDGQGKAIGEPTARAPGADPHAPPGAGRGRFLPCRRIRPAQQRPAT